MKVSVIPAASLGPEHRRRWQLLQQDDPAFASPYLSPEFTDAVAAVRDGVYVGVLAEGGEIVGFFPFQRAEAPGEPPAGEPVGEGVCDYQAVVAAAGAQWSAAELLSGCGLESWSFSHLAADQAPFQPYHRQLFEHTHIDLSRGFADWAAARRAAGSRLLKQTGRRRRKLAREVGPLRFELQVRDPAVLAELMRLKSEQYLRTGQPDCFAVPWISALVRRLAAVQAADFAGLLSALWAGDALVAAHFGMRSRSVWHWWFPVYEPRFAPYSPGLVLDLMMAESAAEMGIRRIELGKKCSHKQRLMTGARPVARGCARLK